MGSGRGRPIGARFDCADDAAVVSEGAFVGMVPTERLLSASDDDVARLGGYLAPLGWDLGFLAFGIVLIASGAALARSARVRRPSAWRG